MITWVLVIALEGFSEEQAESVWKARFNTKLSAGQGLLCIHLLLLRIALRARRNDTLSLLFLC